jgi:hypothetical protein
MKEDIAKIWVEALRSGKYKQAMGTLERYNHGKITNCCLGVLCDLAVQAGVTERQPPDVIQIKQDYYRVGFSKGHWYGSTLPPDVMAWAGVHDTRVAVSGASLLDNHYNLSEINDAGHGFEVIAGIIEKRWKDL